jgi:hypothetical protein
LMAIPYTPKIEISCSNHCIDSLTINFRENIIFLTLLKQS